MALAVENHPVLVPWGRKYGLDEVTHPVRTVRSQSKTKPGIPLITDRPNEGLDPDVIQRPIPEFFLQPEFTGRGCQARLAMSQAKVVPGDPPSGYLGLDSVVMGDLACGLSLQRKPQIIATLAAGIEGIIA